MSARNTIDPNLVRADEDEKEVREDAGAKLDRLLGHMDSLHKRMDALEAARKDGEESEKEAHEDGEESKKEAHEDDESEDEREDRRRDGESEEAWKARRDKARKDKMRKDKTRRDGMDEDPTEALEPIADKHKKDGEESEEEREAREDAERADKEDAEKAMADAVNRATTPLIHRIRDLEAAYVRPRTDEENDAFAAIMARADSTAVMLGQRGAPSPMPGEALINYRRRVLKGFQKFSKRYGAVDLGVVMADARAFDVIEEGIYADAAAAANSPDTVEPGRLRTVTHREGAHVINEFVGDPDSWMNDIAGHRQAVKTFKVPATA